MTKINNNSSSSSNIKKDSLFGSGIRDKWKKVSKATTKMVKATTTTTTTTPPKKKTRNVIVGKSDIRRNNNNIHGRVGMEQEHSSADDSSDEDLESVDLRTPPTTPSPTPTKEHARSSTKKNKKKTTAATTTSMMTPDMLETLGLTEIFIANENENDNDNNNDNRGYVKNSKLQADRSPVTDIKSHDSHARRTHASRRLYHDYDTYMSSSSSEDYEPIPRAAGTAHDEWTIDNNEEDDDDDDNNTYIQYYRNAAGADCDVLSCLGLVLALPVACGLLCLDNIVDTGLFDAATTAKKNQSQRASISTSTSGVETLSPRGSGDAKNYSSSSSSSSSSSNNKKEQRQRRTKQKIHRDRDRDRRHSNDDGGCEIFPSTIELPINKIIAPCW